MPKSILGKMSPTAYISERSLFVVIKAYLDKSGQEDQELFTLGAVAASDDVWAEIDTDWDTILKTNKPPASYMHMVEAIPLRGEFNPARGWNDEHVFGLVDLLLSYLSVGQPKDRYRYCHFSCSLKMNDYRKLLAETYQLDSPADIIASACVRQISTWYFEHYQGLDYEGHYYFDQGEPFEEIIKAKWNRARLDHNPKYQWGHITRIGSAVMRKTPGLQIADMIAWATNRHEVGIPQRYDKFVIGLRHLLPSFWVLIDERQLRSYYRPLILNPYDHRQI